MATEILYVGPPGCLDADTVLLFRSRGDVQNFRIEDAYLRYSRHHRRNLGICLETLSVLDNNLIGYNEIEEIVYSGEKEVFEVTDVYGYSISVTAKHPFLTPSGEYIPLNNLHEASEVMIGEGFSLRPSQIWKIKSRGIRKTYDLVMKAPYHNYMAHNFAVHNTGKSTHIIRQVELAIKKYGPDKVMLCSLTKAAASELSSRDCSINPDMIGTIHAHTFRGLGRPRLAETKDGIASWNENHPTLVINATAQAPDQDNEMSEQGDGKGRGDELLQKINLLRARCVDSKRWPSLLQDFYKQWCDWKNLSERMDFADLIEESMHRLMTAPGAPDVIFVDEAQDLSRAEHKLLQMWSAKTQAFVVVGDPDQSLFHWRGSDPEVMNIKRVPKEQVRILSQSYRVPQMVHSEALRLINSINDRNLVEYKPTEVEGFVRRSSATIKNLQPIERDLNTFLEEGKRVMFLASCSYMLNPIIAWLKEKGIPYGNPYASRWNPLMAAGITKSLQLYDYLAPSKEYNKSPKFWTLSQLKTALHKVKSTGVLKRGWKKKLEVLDDEVLPEQLALVLREIFEPEALGKFLGFDLKWYRDLFGPTMDYPLRIVKKYGRDSLLLVPKVTIGTIHSVKGGESDVVILFPDLSYNGFLQYGKRGFGGKDAIKRMFYVGMTRSREGLIICKPDGARFAKI